jgi:hypothetical protein
VKPNYHHQWDIIGILSVTILLLPTITAEFLTLAAPDAFGQQLIFDNIDKDRSGSALDTTNNNNNNIMTDDNIVAISTTTGTNDSTGTPSSNVTETIPMITLVDVINSTYSVPKEDDEEESESRIGRAVGDRINDVIHTVVRSNATITTTATVRNDLTNESTTINNNTTRFLEEIVPAQVGIALERIRAREILGQFTSQPADPLLELQTDIETVCVANSISLADCDIYIRLR